VEEVTVRIGGFEQAGASLNGAPAFSLPLAVYLVVLRPWRMAPVFG